MSQHLINQYLGDLDRLRRVSGVNRESVVREAFKDLLKAWGRSRELQFIPEHEYITPTKERRYIDGALLHGLRVPFGYWEAKDTNDDLDEEIAKKFRRGYPQTNIIFEDSTRAILIQHGQEVMRCGVDDVENLNKLLELFFGYQRPEIADFRKAIEQFKFDLPAVLKALRERIDEAYAGNKAFATAARAFLKQAQATINPAVTDADVREMLIQHILTEDIFARVFGESDFHRENNVAKALYTLEQLFFRGEIKQQTLHALEPYYAAIRSTAALIQSHSEKQGFLKAIYENFYKVYNAKAADRLGVVYTPNEIVRFMVDSADWLCEKHFGKNLIDKDVEILDPATGTGTFIVELLEHFRGRTDALKYKYQNELHANEVAILPYYVANLNIEATYAAITGQYADFPNLCFVDTLDNTEALRVLMGQHYGDLLGGISTENVQRIKRQNGRKISVVIGNPPYNAWQENFNQRNANRLYARIDERIAATYVKEGTAQNQSSVYDMYTRFIRWASDRVADDGVITFITGRKPFTKAAYDGFRKVVARDFAEVWVVDLGGDVRENPRLSGTKHNVFGIQTGVAITFLVKKKNKAGAVIRYVRRPEMETAEEKLSFLSSHSIKTLTFQTIVPDRKNDWLDQAENNWDEFIPLVDAANKSAKSASQDRAIVRLVSNGLQTKRDDWVYDFDFDALIKKIKALVAGYEKARSDPEAVHLNEIKWDREITGRLKRKVKIAFDKRKIVASTYRPFTGKFVYFDRDLNSQSFRLHEMYDYTTENPTITFLSIASSNPLAALATKGQFDTCLLKKGNGSTQGISRWRLSKEGGRVDNITDWALEQFTAHYGDKAAITKDDIFAYVYGVLHDPIYRETYALNLKREFPRIPFYPDFKRWRDWGKDLLKLHLDYEAAEPFPVVRTDTPDEKVSASGQNPRVILKSDRDSGTIVLDAETKLSGVPAAAWEYTLANRPAIDWVLGQRKETMPDNEVVREKFNTYRFADYKEEVIDLLKRVVTVSVKTVSIVEMMRTTTRLIDNKRADIARERLDRDPKPKRRKAKSA
ncbi:type ISP restriction/modification enzyme [Bradyrhizobium retamae]|uniref:type ISP restriction/modification enzyme n=1 Tax=Bradyrhizobium retamae TaxID=1300035 RepID=UPI0009E6D288|nr:type ISP restriction/modification enzyme [Bradyrhizobium retamae]